MLLPDRVLGRDERAPLAGVRVGSGLAERVAQVADTAPFSWSTPQRPVHGLHQVGVEVPAQTPE